MDSLDNTVWDVVISGTGLRQSLLALALSRSNKKVLHLDRNPYYGGAEAALSLSEAATWTQQHNGNDLTFSHASIQQYNEKELGSSRSYSLSLAPHLIFTRSNLLPAMVSSKVHSQLEFQAVGSWFVLRDDLVKVPSGREDIFQDSHFSLRDKRSLMKFIRHINNPEESSDLSTEAKATSVPIYLEKEFGLPSSLHAPIMALTLSPVAPTATTTQTALPNVIRHLQSIGLFGPGFGALLPKWGGLAEITQVCCRAGAVGGAVYVLNRGVDVVDAAADLSLTLSNGDKVKTTWLVGGAQDLSIESTTTTICSRSITVVDSPLSRLFPQTSEGGVTPAGAVISVPGSIDEPPVYIFAHSSDSGECPAGQCVLYASVALRSESGFIRLQQTIAEVLSKLDDAKPLWTMQFQHNGSRVTSSTAEKVMVVSDSGSTLALEDDVLEEVKTMWQQITEEDVEKFMKFEAREGVEDEMDEQ